MYPFTSVESTRQFLQNVFVHELPSGESHTLHISISWLIQMLCNNLEDNAGVFTSYSVDSSSCQQLMLKSSATARPLHGCRFASFASAVFPSSEEKVVAVGYPVVGDKIFDRASTLGDQSLLLKYLNPHAVALATKSSSGLHLTLMDSISAHVLYRVFLVNGEEPVNLALVENHIVCSYWNRKALRTEVSSTVLYEGMVGKVLYSKDDTVHTFLF